jgi:hypothetical protein
MKALFAVLGVLMTVGVVVVCAVVELLVKLWPLLGLAAWIWIGIKVWRRWRERRANRDHIDAPWRWEHPAQGPVPLGEDPLPTPRPPAVSVAPAPALPVAGRAASLPPIIARQDRSFVVRGHDSGLLADRADGYLYVSAQELPRVPRMPATHQHRPNVASRRTSGRREVRRRP